MGEDGAEGARAAEAAAQALAEVRAYWAEAPWPSRATVVLGAAFGVVTCLVAVLVLAIVAVMLAGAAAAGLAMWAPVAVVGRWVEKRRST